MYRPTFAGGNRALQIGGLLSMGFGAVATPLFLFVIPASCTFVLVIELLGLVLLFFGGIVAFVLGKFFIR